MKFYFYGRQERARALGAALCGRKERCERTTGRRRREREPSSSHFLRLSSPFPSRSVSLYLRPRRPTPRPASRRAVSRSSLATPRFSTLARARACSLAGISPGRDLAFSLRPALFVLRPFNSIATSFYNAATPVQRERKSRWLLTLRLTQRAISRSYMNGISSYLQRSQGMRVTRGSFVITPDNVHVNLLKSQIRSKWLRLLFSSYERQTETIALCIITNYLLTPYLKKCGPLLIIVYC